MSASIVQVFAIDGDGADDAIVMGDVPDTVDGTIQPGNEVGKLGCNLAFKRMAEACPLAVVLRVQCHDLAD